MDFTPLRRNPCDFHDPYYLSSYFIENTQRHKKGQELAAIGKQFIHTSKRAFVEFSKSNEVVTFKRLLRRSADAAVSLWLNALHPSVRNSLKSVSDSLLLSAYTMFTDINWKWLFIFRDQSAPQVWSRTSLINWRSCWWRFKWKKCSATLILCRNIMQPVGNEVSHVSNCKVRLHRFMNDTVNFHRSVWEWLQSSGILTFWRNAVSH